MEWSLDTISLFLALLTMALSSGLFYAWSVSVIPGTLQVSHRSYLETMQRINQKILNIGFYSIFFGALITLILSSYLYYQVEATKLFWYILLATLCYGIGTFGITMVGNIPLNNSLDLLDLSTMDTQELATVRTNYEKKWNFFHRIRSIAAVFAFLLLLLGVFVDKLH